MVQKGWYIFGDIRLRIKTELQSLKPFIRDGMRIEQIHIHLKVRDFEGPEKIFEWTSQLYLNNSINELVHTQPPYSNHGPVPMTNEQDFIFMDLQQMV